MRPASRRGAGDGFQRRGLMDIEYSTGDRLRRVASFVGTLCENATGGGRWRAAPLGEERDGGAVVPVESAQGLPLLSFASLSNAVYAATFDPATGRVLGDLLRLAAEDADRAERRSWGVADRDGAVRVEMHPMTRTACVLGRRIMREAW